MHNSSCIFVHVWSWSIKFVSPPPEPEFFSNEYEAPKTLILCSQYVGKVQHAWSKIDYYSFGKSLQVILQSVSKLTRGEWDVLSTTCKCGKIIDECYVSTPRGGVNRCTANLWIIMRKLKLNCNTLSVTNECSRIPGEGLWTNSPWFLWIRVEVLYEALVVKHKWGTHKQAKHIIYEWAIW